MAAFNDVSIGDAAGDGAGECDLCGVLELLWPVDGLSSLLELSALFDVSFADAVAGFDGSDGSTSVSTFELLGLEDLSDDVEAAEDDEFVARPLICNSCPIFMKACNSVCLTFTTPWYINSKSSHIIL